MRQQIPCAICAESGKNVPSKYKCPACEIATCSLSCVKKHKSDSNCSGVRNPSKYISKTEYDENIFMNDYTLLEDTACQIRRASRIRYTPTSSTTASNQHNTTSKGYMRMLTEENKKRGIFLTFLPGVYTRHQSNRTYVKRMHASDTERTVFWTLSINMFQKYSIDLKDCNENESLNHLIFNHIVVKRTLKKLEIDLEDDDTSKFNVFLKNEVNLFNQQQARQDNDENDGDQRKMTENFYNHINIRKFIWINSNQTLLNCLKKKYIIEYPMFHIVLKGSEESKQMERQCYGIFEKPETKADEEDTVVNDDDDDDDDGDEVEEDSGSGSGSGSEEEDDDDEDGKVGKAGKTLILKSNPSDQQQPVLGTQSTPEATNAPAQSDVDKESKADDEAGRDAKRLKVE